MKKIMIAALAAILIGSGLYLTYKREFDQFNPLYKAEYVYVFINEPAKPEGKEHIRYRFNLTGYTEHGDKKKITFSSSDELKQGTYVKVHAKGAYTKTWNFIKKEDVPNHIANVMDQSSE